MDATFLFANITIGIDFVLKNHFGNFIVTGSTLDYSPSAEEAEGLGSFITTRWASSFFSVDSVIYLFVDKLHISYTQSSETTITP